MGSLITKWMKRIIITIPYPKNKILLSSSIKSLFSSKNHINIFYQIISFLIMDETNNLETNKEKYYYYMNIVLDTISKEKEKNFFLKDDVVVLMKYIKEEEIN